MIVHILLYMLISDIECPLPSFLIINKKPVNELLREFSLTYFFFFVFYCADIFGHSLHDKMLSKWFTMQEARAFVSPTGAIYTLTHDEQCVFLALRFSSRCWDLQNPLQPHRSKMKHESFMYCRYFNPLRAYENDKEFRISDLENNYCFGNVISWIFSIKYLQKIYTLPIINIRTHWLVDSNIIRILV